MKYAALILNVLALALLSWGLVGISNLAGTRVPASRMPSVELKPLPEEQWRQQAAVSEALSILQASRAAPATQEGLLALPAVQPQSTHIETAAAAPSPLMLPEQPRPDPVVTLVLKDEHGYSAENDGRKVRAGDRLSQGVVVREISMNQIVLAEGRQRQVLPIPLESLRIQGLTAPVMTKVNP